MTRSATSPHAVPRLTFRGGARQMGVFLLISLLLYYPVGMAVVHSIDDDLTFAAGDVPDGGSQAVAVAAALIERETDLHRWTANDPFFLPGAALDNMPNFQKGIVYALGRFTIEMSDHIGRVRGTSGVDADLDRAAGLLKYPGDVWWMDLSTSLAPTAASETQYRAARRALLSYNKRLSRGNAVFETRSDNLEATLQRIAADIGSLSATIDQRIDDGWIIDFKADDVFYNIKGRLYAYALLLEALKADYAKVIRERELDATWDQMLDSLRDAASLQPYVILNGDPDSQLAPSHLAAQGFYLIRARTQIKEVASILLK